MPSTEHRDHNDLKYRSHRALTWSYLPLPNGKVCKVGQTMAQWWRSCWWKKPGVQAACTDRSRVRDTRRVPVRSRRSRTFVQIEAGGFYPRFYGISDCHGLLTVQNPAKIVYFKTCSKCPPQAFTQARSLFTKLSMALLMEFCGRSSHIVCKT